MGKRLFYVTQEGNRLMAVDVQTTPTVAFGEPVLVAPEIQVLGQLQARRIACLQ